MLLCHLGPLHKLFFAHHSSLANLRRWESVEAEGTQRAWVPSDWKEVECSISLKANYFPTCFIRVKHAKWACNILTFVPCGIQGHKCPAYHNTCLHNACKTGLSPGAHIHPFITQNSKKTVCWQAWSWGTQPSAQVAEHSVSSIQSDHMSGSFSTCICTDGKMVPWHQCQ